MYLFAAHQQQLQSRNDYELISIPTTPQPPQPPAYRDYFAPPNVPVGETIE